VLCTHYAFTAVKGTQVISRIQTYATHQQLFLSYCGNVKITNTQNSDWALQKPILSMKPAEPKQELYLNAPKIAAIKKLG